MATDFPKKGDDKEISLRNSKFKQFDYSYAKDLRKNWPSIWSKGGNIRGNSAFTNWGKARSGELTSAVKSWIKEREAWSARHFEDHLIAGVVAQIKWGMVGSRGASFMKSVVNEAKKKQRKGEKIQMEIKKLSGSVTNLEEGQKTYKGIPVGVIKCYIATWDVDRGNDKFHQGAFLDSIEEHKRLGRDIKLKDMHGNSVGVFPADLMGEDGTGLFGTGYINLEIQQGKEAHSKAIMGIYDRMSIGFSPIDAKGEFPFGRDIYKAHIWEGSLVDEPMNLAADIVDVKSAVDYQDLPIADTGKSWDSSKAEQRVRDWADAKDKPNARYKRAFLWFDNSDPESFGSYKLPIADVVDGRLVAVPRAIFAAAAAIQGARGGVKISDEEKNAVRKNLDRYYEKMGKQTPWGEKMLGDFLGNEDSIKEMSIRDIEQTFIDAGCSEKQAKTLISSIKGVANKDNEPKYSDEEVKDFNDLMDFLKKQ